MSPQFYYDKNINDDTKLAIRQLKSREFEKIESQMCSICRIDKNKNFKKIKDRVEALLRDPAYLQLVQEIKQSEDLYGIPKVLDNSRHKELTLKMMREYGVYDPIYEFDKKILCPYKMQEYFDPEEINTAVIRVMTRGQSKRIETSQGRFLYYESSYALRNGKWLNVEINLSQSKRKIMDEISKRIDIYKRHVVDLESRGKMFNFDPWLIYDMHKGGLNFSQIAKSLSGIDENPSYNAHVMKTYKAVKRAYAKACELLKATKIH